MRTTTASLKLLAETFPWRPGSVFAYTQDNHTSVLGMRAIASAAGAATRCVTARRTAAGGFAFTRVGSVDQVDSPAAQPGVDHPSKAPCLFVFPAESNLTGVRYDPQLAAHVTSHGVDEGGTGEWLVCVDAAKACGTGPPDARRCAADAFVLSYYKVTGHLAAAGCIVVCVFGIVCVVCIFTAVCIHTSWDISFLLAMCRVKSTDHCHLHRFLSAGVWLPHWPWRPGGQAVPAASAPQALRRRRDRGGGTCGYSICTVRC